MADTNIGTAYVKIMPTAKGISGEISKQMGPEAKSAGKSAGHSMVGAIKGVIAGAAIGKVFKDALEAGGNLQQSFGGLDTIYEGAAEQMKKFASEAASAGISANDYAEQAVSFGASLKQAFGDDLDGAAKAANTAIMDMADNAAKMGTDISSIQTAYQGFAKQNYTMLDNLKLGYGGTKSEMERLLKDAKELTGVEYNIDNLGDVYAAIHAIQENLHLTGVAADEAKETFSGSFGAMKASATNLLANLALGNDVSQSLSDLVEKVKTFLLGNLVPMVWNILKSLPGIIGTALTDLFTNLPGMVDAAIGFIKNLTEAIKGNDGTFMSGIAELAKTAWEALKNTDWIGLGSSILTLLWEGLKALAPVLWKGLKTIGLKAWEMFKNIDWAGVGSKVITFIGDAIGSIGHLIWEALTSLGETASQKFEDVDWAEAGQNAFHMLVDAITNIGSTLWEALTTIATTAGEHFKDVDWGQVGQDALEAIANGLAAIGGFLYEAITTVATSASEFFRDIDWEQAGKDAITFIVDGIGNIATTLWEAITTIGETASEKMKDIDWKQCGIDVLTAIKDGLESIGSFFWGALQGIGSTAKEKILEIDWIQSGIDIINGIVEGIGNVGHLIGEKIKEVGGSALSTFTSFFQIGSPSKLMADKAKWIPIGIAEGIEKGSKSVMDAMDDLAADASGVNITPTIDGSASLASGLAGGIGNVIMNITVNGADNPEDWGTRLARQLTMVLRMA